MIEGADGVSPEPNTHTIEIVEQGLLVEPGSFVLDIQQAAPCSVNKGHLVLLIVL